MVKIISWNVNGYRSSLGKGFKEFLTGSGADVAGLQEVKVLPEQLKAEDMAFSGYNSEWCPALRRGYSGVAAFFRKPPLAVSRGLGEARFDSEGRVIALEYADFHLLNVYFPNGGAGPERLKFKLEFYDAFFEHAQRLRKTGKPVIFCGDVNTAHKEIDLARPRENADKSGFMPVERAWLDKITGEGWTDTFRMFEGGGGKYTWWDYKTRARERDTGWRIDYFFINSEAKALVKSAFILSDIPGSDHCPVGIDLDCRLP
jgi:exodeoxyribonuclease-3